jgi:nucleolar GTP-binding protein
LLQARVEVKMRGQKLNDVLNKINLAIPKPRDQLVRSPFIPDQVKERRRYDPMDPERPLLERDLEAENGGAGVYNIDLKKKYITDDPEWRHDIIPEILNGHNVADFIDPDIEAKLEALELEEERLQQEGHYDEDDEEMNSEDERIRATAEKIRDERKLRKILHQTKLGKNRVAVTPKMLNKRKVAQTNTSALEGDSMDVDGVAAGMKRQRSISRALSIARSTSRAPIKKRLTSATRDRSTMGLKNVQQKERSEGIHKKAQRANNLHGKKGEADRAIGAKLPKHLFSGKRGIGKTQRR